MACLFASNITIGVAKFNTARRRLGGAYLPIFLKGVIKGMGCTMYYIVRGDSVTK